MQANVAWRAVRRKDDAIRMIRSAHRCAALCLGPTALAIALALLLPAAEAQTPTARGPFAPSNDDAGLGALSALAVQDRPSPFAADAVYVGPHDVQPSESEITASTANGEPYAYLRGVRGKSGLELQGSAIDSGGTFCFGAGLDLPDSARIVAVTAFLADPDGPDERADAAEVFLQERPWDETRAGTLVALDAPGGGYAEATATGDELPATVARSQNEYRLMTCIRGDGGFLGARVTYLLP